jgi:glutathionyl-hydroquinone reductase
LCGAGRRKANVLIGYKQRRDDSLLLKCFDATAITAPDKESQMGALINGVWSSANHASTVDGRFVREPSRFQNWITPSGCPGPTGVGGYPAEAGRYHLYVSLACPWAHRVLIARRILGLEGTISVSVVHWHMGSDGWTFEVGPGVIPDPIFRAQYLYEIYTSSAGAYTGRVTVPILFDKASRSIVNNESSDILRMLNSAFPVSSEDVIDLYPAELREDIDAVNALVYDNINNGVYKAGFATTQSAYEDAVISLFDALDLLEQRLAGRRYLCGEQFTEADIRLFTTLVRFDAVYVGHFKCNRRRLVDYPNLWAYTRDIYRQRGIDTTVDMLHIKRHYYESHLNINPYAIVPLGPCIDFFAPSLAPE